MQRVTKPMTIEEMIHLVRYETRNEERPWLDRSKSESKEVSQVMGQRSENPDGKSLDASDSHAPNA